MRQKCFTVAAPRRPRSKSIAVILQSKQNDFPVLPHALEPPQPPIYLYIYIYVYIMYMDVYTYISTFAASQYHDLGMCSAPNTPVNMCVATSKLARSCAINISRFNRVRNQLMGRPPDAIVWKTKYRGRCGWSPIKCHRPPHVASSSR